jgi:hypothetical protein
MTHEEKAAGVRLSAVLARRYKLADMPKLSEVLVAEMQLTKVACFAQAQGMVPEEVTEDLFDALLTLVDMNAEDLQPPRDNTSEAVRRAAVVMGGEHLIRRRPPDAWQNVATAARSALINPRAGQASLWKRP